MPLHPQRERLQSAQRQKAVERPRDRADRILQKRDLIAELLVFSHDDHAAHHVGVAIQIFRRGMNDHIESEFDRPLNPRAGESIIGNADGVVRARDFRDRFQVDQLEQRIARRFHPDHARVWPHRFLDRARIGHVDKSEIEIRGSAADAFEKPERSAVEIVAHDHVRAAVEPVEDRGHPGETGRERPAARTAFEIGDATLVGAARGIDRARIIVALVPAGTLLDVSRRLVDRRHDRPGRRVGRLAGVDDARGDVVLFLHGIWRRR